MKLDTWLDKTYKLRAETAVGPKVMWGDGKNTVSMKFILING